MKLPQQDRMIRMVCEHFDTLLFEHQHFDLDGLCIGLLCLLTDPSGPKDLIGNALRNRYRILICDEFQDLNRNQLSILEKLAQTRTGAPDAYLTVVGDPNQSIFNFRGSMGAEAFSYLKHFFARCKSEAKEMQLTKGWRCPRSVVNSVNKLIANNYARVDNTGMLALDEPREQTRQGSVEVKTWPSANAEFKGIATTIQAVVERSRGAQYKDVVVLARNNYSLLGFRQALIEEGIPCRGVGSSFSGSRPPAGLRKKEEQGPRQKRSDTVNNSPCKRK